MFPVVRNTGAKAACQGGGAGGFAFDGSNEDAAYRATVAYADRSDPPASLVLRKPAEDGVRHGGGVVPCTKRTTPTTSCSCAGSRAA
ncbi:MAG: hypothetical protein D6731_00475 [Planctomycetota bacterium]|nr:MAG: hypothetical protein D6731_00475 [Planctomycetota bacterium]